jgi:hypothetical protein
MADRRPAGPGRGGAAALLILGAIVLLLAVPLALGLPGEGGPGSPGDPAAPGVTPGTTGDPDDDPDVTAGSREYLVIDREDLMALPTEGPAWDAVLTAARGDWAWPDLMARDTDSPVLALAAGLVYARTGDEAARARVERALRGLQEAPSPSDLLSTVRQLPGWIIAADLIGYRDPDFERWVHSARVRTIGSHPRWRTIYGTAGETSNNYGTFALASLIAADRYLGDTLSLERSWEIFQAYGIPFGYPFTKTLDWDEAYSCVPTDPERRGRLPIAINPAGCRIGGANVDGMPVEDAAREDRFPDPHPGYVNEAMQGYALQALLLERAGYAAFDVNDRQVLRVAEYQQRWGIWNAHPTGYYVAWIINHAYGTDFPTESDTSGGRAFGWTDWLYGSG